MYTNLKTVGALIVLSIVPYSWGIFRFYNINPWSSPPWWKLPHYIILGGADLLAWMFFIITPILILCWLFKKD